jgi:hypothetical protein
MTSLSEAFLCISPCHTDVFETAEAEISSYESEELIAAQDTGADKPASTGAEFRSHQYKNIFGGSAAVSHMESRKARGLTGRC